MRCCISGELLPRPDFSERKNLRFLIAQFWTHTNNRLRLCPIVWRIGLTVWRIGHSADRKESSFYFTKVYLQCKLASGAPYDVSNQDSDDAYLRQKLFRTLT
jgi:hypothetical protein